MAENLYENPLVARYAGRAMAELWSGQKKFSTWRRLWVALARAERELGLNITEAQIAELEAILTEAERLRAEVRRQLEALDRLAERVSAGAADGGLALRRQ